jgi:hypothetical protein
MRRCGWLAGVVCGLAAAGSASAQAMTWGGTVPSNLQYQVVGGDYSKVPVGTSTSRSSSFSLSGIFRSVGLISNQPVFGSSNYPTFNQLPGSSYFVPFRMQRPKPISQ